MKKNRFVAIAAALGGAVIGLSQPAFTEEAPPGTPASPHSVGGRIEELDQKIRILERKWELEQERAGKEAGKRAVAGADEKGFFLQSADGAYQMKLRGYVQTDGRFFIDDDEQPATNDFLLRRVRPIVEGTLARHFRFRIMPDFGQGKTVLQDAYLESGYWQAFQVRVGKFKAPLGLERLQSAVNLLFIERALPTDLVPNRDIGLQIGGDLGEGVFGYAVGVFNGVPDGGSADVDGDNDKDAVGRIFAHPFRRSGIGPLKGLGIGVAGSYGDQDGGLPSFKSPGQQTFFKYKTGVVADGRRWRVSPQFNWYFGPVGLLGEYVRSVQEVSDGNGTADLANEAWQVAASFVITGEDASYGGVKPKRPFDPRNGAWGAVELAARYHKLEVDSDAFPVFADPAKAARTARAWAGGINWHLNRHVKVAANYERTAFERGGATGDRETEKVLLTRFQVAY